MTDTGDVQEVSENPVSATFEAVARLMDGALGRWFVIGGAGMVLHGLVPDRFNDVDVVIGEDDATRLRGLGQVRASNTTPTHRFRASSYLEYDETPIKIEFMAGLQVRVRTDWIPVEPRRLVRRRLGEARLYVPEASDLARLFRMFGRDRDLDRAQRLDGLVKAHRASAQAKDDASGPHDRAAGGGPT